MVRTSVPRLATKRAWSCHDSRRTLVIVAIMPAVPLARSTRSRKKATASAYSFPTITMVRLWKVALAFGLLVSFRFPVFVTL